MKPRNAALTPAAAAREALADEFEALWPPGVLRETIRPLFDVGIRLGGYRPRNILLTVRLLARLSVGSQPEPCPGERVSPEYQLLALLACRRRLVTAYARRVADERRYGRARR